MAGDDDELEYVLLNKRDVMVYQVPPAAGASGHKADDWKKCIWRGRCQIAGKGSSVSIKLIDSSSGNLFAQCMIPNGEHEKYVERTVDSSRYFVLKITNGARHAFIGLGFEDRNDAFDFNCTLSDFKSTWVDKDKQAEEAAAPGSTEPSKDFSLKEGQKISINLEGFGLKGRKREEKPSGGDGGFVGLLAPPPPGGSSRKQGGGAPAPALQPPPVQSAFVVQAAAAAPAAGFDADFGDFDDFQSSGASPAPAFQSSPPAAVPAFSPAPAPVPVSDLASQFDHFGFGGPAPAARPAPVPAAAPAAQLADPFARPAMTMQQKAPVATPPSNLDPFGDLTGLASLSKPQATPPQPFGAAAAPARAKSAFDEFDIFK